MTAAAEILSKSIVTEGTIRQILNFMSWRLVRNLGELQILTNVSYVTLIIVPVLATMWPGVHYLINSLNNFVHTDISETLPLSWAIAFFAALATVVAKFLYQASAPEIVKQSTLNQYINSQIEDYIKHPISEKLENAILIISSTEQQRLSDTLVNILYLNNMRRLEDLQDDKLYQSLSNDNKERILQIGMIVGIPGPIRQKLESDLNKLDKSIETRNIGIIAQAARIDYAIQSHRNIVIMLLVSLLYGIAIYLLAKIAWHQSLIIFKAADASLERMFFY